MSQDLPKQDLLLEQILQDLDMRIFQRGSHQRFYTSTSSGTWHLQDLHASTLQRGSHQKATEITRSSDKDLDDKVMREFSG